MPVDPTASSQARPQHNDITVGVRPEAWRLVSESEGGLPVDVTVVEELGADGFVYGTSDVEGTPGNVIVRVSSAATRCTRATPSTSRPTRSNVHVFDTDTGERLSD